MSEVENTDTSIEITTIAANVSIFNPFAILASSCSDSSSSSPQAASKASQSCGPFLPDINSNLQLFPYPGVSQPSPESETTPSLQKIAQEKEIIDQKVETFVKSIHDFMKIEPREDENATIMKLESLKTLLKTESERSKFDELINEAKEAKIFQEAAENLKKDDSDECYEYEDHPQYYWDQEYEFEDPKQSNL